MKAQNKPSLCIPLQSPGLSPFCSSDTAGTHSSQCTGTVWSRSTGELTLLGKSSAREVQKPVDGCLSLLPFRQTSLRRILYMSHQVLAESSRYCPQQCPQYYILMLAFMLLTASHLLPRIISQIDCLHPSPCLRLYFHGNSKKNVS